MLAVGGVNGRGPTTGVRGQRRRDCSRRREVAVDRSGTDRRIREYLRRGRSDQRTRIVDGGRIDLPRVPPVGQCHVGARDRRRTRTGRQVRGEPVVPPLEVRPGDVGEGSAAEQRGHVHRMPVDVQLHQRGDEAVTLVFFATQGFHQLGVVQSGAEGDRGDGDEHGRVGCELDESAVPVLDRLGDRLAEPHAVAQALEKVLDGVHRSAGPVVGLPVHRAVDATGDGQWLDAGELVGQFTQDRLDLRGVAGALGCQLAAQLALGLGARDDRIDLRLRPTDHGVRRCRIDADLQVRVVDEDRGDVLGAVLDQGHQADVVALQRRLPLGHQARTLADDASGVRQRKPAADVGGRRLPHRVGHQYSGLGTEVAHRVGQRNLDRVDPDLTGLDAVGLLVVEEDLGDRVAQLALHVLVDSVDVLAEDRVLQV